MDSGSERFVGLSLDMPMKLEPCRVYRTFLGGKLLDEWLGIEGKDDHFPRIGLHRQLRPEMSAGSSLRMKVIHMYC